MPKESLKRKLAAILSADVKGYGRLMNEDEASTIHTLTAYKETMSVHIKQRRGRVVDAPGDNLLAEFASVVDAVQCAVEIQRDLAERNEELPKDRKMVFRIGVNLGDVVEQKDRIYGDGVNIAARLENICDGGGVCISGTAFEHVENKLDLEYENLGEHHIKNISRPIRVYRVLFYPGTATHRVVQAIEPLEPASVENMAFPLPEKPSIAVLPFDNMSGDPEQDYIADGFTENIITGLSQIPEMFVIARNSVFTYKGKPVMIKQVSEEMGVKYVLEGSIQKAGDRLRVNAQLIDAVTGYHMWSEKFDREMKDFFQLLDDITHKVVVELQVKLTHGEQVRKWYGTTNFESWGYTAKGTSLFETYTKANNERAKELFNQALAVDSKNAFALCMLSWTYVIDVRLGFSKSPSESLEKATQIAQKAQAIDDSLPEVHALWNTIYLFQRQYDKAIAAGQKSIELGPNSALSYILFAQTMCYAGNFEDAVDLAERSIRLSPYYPVWYALWLARSYRHAGRYEDALDVFEEIQDRAQKGEYHPSRALFHLGITYAMMGKYEESLIHLTKSINQISNIVDYYRHHYSYFKNPDHFNNIFDSLRKAGIE